MNFFEILITSLSVAMDASAASIGKGLCLNKNIFSDAMKIALYFGSFQALMPLIGFFLGKSFASAAQRYDHWIAFALLFLIGANMLREGILKLKSDKNGISSVNKSVDSNGNISSPGVMLPLAVATSIDALAVGVGFSLLNVNLPLMLLSMGTVTFLCSFISVYIGRFFGDKLASKAELAGGLVLIFLGIKLLARHILEKI